MYRDSNRVILTSANNIKSYEFYSNYDSVRHFGDVIIAWDDNSNLIVTITDEILRIYIGDKMFENQNDSDVTIGKDWDPLKHTGSLVEYKRDNGILSIYSDFLGSEPIYYSVTKESAIISNRLDSLVQHGSYSPDLPSVYSFMCTGASVSESTVLQNVKQTRPLQSLHFDINTPNELVTETHDHWTIDNCRKIEDSFEEIDKQFHSILTNGKNVNLMLSAGWDSRLLMSSNIKRVSQTYTHGDLASREVKIAFELSRHMNIPMQFSPISETQFSPNYMTHILKSCGFNLFPHWYYAAELLNTYSSDPLTAGLSVEHISGHYGLGSVLSKRHRVLNILNTLIPVSRAKKYSDSEIFEVLSPHLSKGFASIPWFWHNDVDIESIRKVHESRVRDCIANYLRQGTKGVDEVCERFRLEHEGRQFFALQTKMATGKIGYYHPYADSLLAEKVLSLPFRHRANYKLSQHLIKNSNPKLLSQPMAATLIKASYPIILQEMSRILRIGYEGITSRLNYDKSSPLGWNNFDFLYKTNYFHEYIDMLKDDMWDKSKMHTMVSQSYSKKLNPYFLLDMLLKAQTTDFKLHPDRY